MKKKSKDRIRRIIYSDEQVLITAGDVLQVAHQATACAEPYFENAHNQVVELHYGITSIAPQPHVHGRDGREKNAKRIEIRTGFPVGSFRCGFLGDRGLLIVNVLNKRVDAFITQPGATILAKVIPASTDLLITTKMNKTTQAVK
jgi:hypothetical protein